MPSKPATKPDKTETTSTGATSEASKKPEKTAAKNLPGQDGPVGEVAVKIEEQTIPDGGIFKGAVGAAKREVGKSRGESGKAEAKPKRKRRSGKKATEEFVEGANMLLVPLVVIATSQLLGESLAAMPEEAEAFTTPVARLAFRHLPIAASASKDMTDIMAILAATAMYLARVGPELKERFNNRTSASYQARTPSPANPPAGGVSGFDGMGDALNGGA